VGVIPFFFIFQNKQMQECFICCSKSGKSNAERLMDNIHHRKMRYPQIPLSYAYGCKCDTTKAHNRCLVNVLKCPTCRKPVAAPYTEVHTTLENYVNLEWVKKYPAKFRMLTGTMVCVSFVLIIANETIKIYWNAWTSCAVLCVYIFTMCLLFVDDYVRKYWLFSF
jgi:hypothetical protein